MQTLGDLKDLMANWVPRMQELGQAYGDFSPQWSNSDPAAFEDFTKDWSQLQARWGPAQSNAQAFIDAGSILPDALVNAQIPYDMVMKAIRQNYPPDGATMQKGDWDDLYQRLSTAKGGLIPITTVQPTAMDLSGDIFKATAQLDVIAALTGQQASALGGLVGSGGKQSPSTSTSGAGWAFVGILAGVAGAFGGSVLGPPGALAGAALGGALGYSLKTKIAASLPSWL
jgi:hypothetical protein